MFQTYEGVEDCGYGHDFCERFLLKICKFFQNHCKLHVRFSGWPILGIRAQSGFKRRNQQLLTITSHFSFLPWRWSSKEGGMRWTPQWSISIFLSKPCGSSASTLQPPHLSSLQMFYMRNRWPGQIGVHFGQGSNSRPQFPKWITAVPFTIQMRPLGGAVATQAYAKQEDQVALEVLTPPWWEDDMAQRTASQRPFSFMSFRSTCTFF